ncbi:conserved protein of unknown function [Kyrpidia spormannii]|uniref:DUF3368 domain-containing protein n=2 Tax=Kyrpidia spormannii TaxID=2055160 RepID=A0A6F9EGE4_9BACL|nr:conserved protein of unknown function [Kyrpidia spormannii]CAB3396112.1 conserved protein of unknown function [Kyrpidia spormannii]
MCNASPMIALSSIGLFHVLGQVFERVAVPQAVWNEVMANRGAVGTKELKSAVDNGEVMVFQVQNQALVEKLSGRLHRGELEVIIGALEQGIGTVLLDDRQARQLAKTFRLEYTGTVGILLAAKAKGLIPEIKAYLDALADQGFRLGETLLRQVLKLADEELAWPNNTAEPPQG